MGLSREWRWIDGLFAAVLLALSGTGMGQVAPAAPAGEEEIAWLREHALPFATTEAGNGFGDLEPLKAIIGDARIVALGESTHGTREFFQMKHRLVEFLASELGFTIFSIEASTPEAYALDEYVLGGSGDPRKLIAGMYFWTWNTEEVLAMVEWMRAFNLSKAGTIHFTGFDMQTPDVAMEIVERFLDDVDPERAEVVRAQHAKMKGAERVEPFGVSTGSFPVEFARGKRVRFSGWIKTEDLRGGPAGLWWRNDLEGNALGGFDNMDDRGPRGTSEWAEYSLELDVPLDTTNINFGCLMPGQGKAWFDSLVIELDGELYVDPGRFDFEFESGLRGLTAYVPGYSIHPDGTSAHGGGNSLCIESLPRDPDAMEVDVAARLALETFEELEGARELLLVDKEARGVEWAIHNARIIEQCMRSRAGGGGVRDQCMADNVAWILEQDPDARIVLWAHNAHVQRASYAMGGHLAAKFGDAYLPIGFATHEGRYFAIGEAGFGDHALVPSPAGSVESVFAATGAPRLMLDLRRSEPGSADSGWLRAPRPFRLIGALAQEEQFFPAAIADDFDVLVYVQTTAAAVQLDPRRGR